MKLLLIRHAAAEERDSARWPDDSQRPLTKRGARRFAALVDLLRPALRDIDPLLSSGYVRAWETAELVASGAGCRKPVRCRALEEEGLPAMLFALREHAVDDDRTVAMVGHEPWMGAFATLLTAGGDAAQAPGRPRFNVRKGAIIALSLSGTPTPGSATLEWMAHPKLLGSGTPA